MSLIVSKKINDINFIKDNSKTIIDQMKTLGFDLKCYGHCIAVHSYDDIENDSLIGSNEIFVEKSNSQAKKVIKGHTNNYRTDIKKNYLFQYLEYTCMSILVNSKYLKNETIKSYNKNKLKYDVIVNDDEVDNDVDLVDIN